MEGPEGGRSEAAASVAEVELLGDLTVGAPDGPLHSPHVVFNAGKRSGAEDLAACPA